MAKERDQGAVRVDGRGWAGGIISGERGKAGKKGVAVERGEEKQQSDYTGVKDALRFRDRFEMMQNLSHETITSRNTMDEKALPVRTRDEMMAGTDLGGGSVHWAGATYRWTRYDFEIRSQTIDRYGEKKIPEGMTIQDWGMTYDEMEPYYDQFEKTAGISGEPDPLGAKRSSDYPTPPMKESPPVRLFKDAAEKLGHHPYQIADRKSTRLNSSHVATSYAVFCL